MQSFQQRREDLSHLAPLSDGITSGISRLENAPAKNFTRRIMRAEGREACEESVFRWRGQLECKAALEDARPVL